MGRVMGLEAAAGGGGGEEERRRGSSAKRERGVEEAGPGDGGGGWYQSEGSALRKRTRSLVDIEIGLLCYRLGFRRRRPLTGHRPRRR